MVVSEIVAATMIAVCGLKNSYRIVLKGERVVRRAIRRPAPIVEGYDTFPRFFIRKVFRAGLVIAMRWEGRAKNAAQLAADARMRARKTSKAVSKRIGDARDRVEDVRSRAQDRAHLMRERAGEMRQKASDMRAKAESQAQAAREKATEMRKRAEDVRDRATDQARLMKEKAAELRHRAEQAKESAIAAKDKLVDVKKRVQQHLSPKENSRKLHTSAFTIVPPKDTAMPFVHTRFSKQ
ncbi:hypothetical protein BWQ96_00831 [Gracilariopsis chorda]|uniref:Uncharacterized protein n=1 Tax=Gracilariopsis chorda TaxID=448386 RepID=A0A2V3J5I9_9FLOR|nr:hypothetical protein BWQ96_00831 [Gracilariopsis chorda]|eukprot:PXF49257.1 hypothetical protein BWQ96_00831 [Gracilariopsis chorda]